MTAFLYDPNLYDIDIQIFKNKYMYIFSRNNLINIFLQTQLVYQWLTK